MQWQHKQRIGQLFGHLVQGHLEEFLSGCTDDLLFTVRGAHPAPVRMQRSDIADWYGSLRALSPTELRSSVEIAHADRHTATVILRHHFARHGVDYLLEMANLLKFRD